MVLFSGEASEMSHVLFNAVCLKYKKNRIPPNKGTNAVVVPP